MIDLFGSNQSFTTEHVKIVKNVKNSRHFQTF